MVGLGRRAIMSGLLATPAVARAQATAKSGTVRVGMNTILSGPIALLGRSQRHAAELEVARINAQGGLAGRTIELVVRDSRGEPQEAARIARRLVQQDGCEILIDAEASAGAFAVQDVVRELGVLCIHTSSETSSLTADPKLRAPTAFRSARQGVHDSIVGSHYAAGLAETKKWTRWGSCAPDYAYGRDTTQQFFDFFKQLKPNVEIVAQAWPKLGQADFSDVMTKMLRAMPNAILTLQFAGDLSAFIDQGNVYSLFTSMAMFNPNLGDYPVLTSVKSLPPGLFAGSRYLDNLPDTPANRAWGEAYRKKAGQSPTNWSWQNATGWMFLEAAAKQAGGVETSKMVEVLTGLTIDCPFGVDGRITMRDDHTIVGYAIGWGRTVPKLPYITDIKAGNWARIVELENAWKKSKGYT